MSNSQILALAGVCLLGVLICALLYFYNRWHTARGMRRARQQVERLHREEDAGISPSPTHYHFAILFDAQGVTVSNLRSCTDNAVTMRWAEVCRATVFKRDLWSVDCICVYLARSDDSGVELDEEMAGWRTFLAALPQHLSGCRPSDQWFSEVASPAFAPNPTEIYRHAVHQIA